MDTPETLAADMLKAAVEAVAAARVVTEVGAFHVKRDARANVLKSAPIHHAHAATAITYDKPLYNGAEITAEIGYDKDLKPGRFGNLLEYGGGGDHSPPHRDLGRALDDEAPRFEKALDALAEKLL